jgi:hypothetical protein
MSEIVHVDTKITYRFICMRRSGHHAIMKWLHYQLKNPKVAINDVTTRKDGMDESHTFYLDDLRYDKKKVRVSEGKIKCDYFAFNHEDEDIEQVLNKHLNTESTVYNIVVQRDMKNLFASRVKCDFVDNTLNAFKESLALFRKYDEYFLDERVFPISYNDWVKSLDYRKDIAKRLEVKFFNDRMHKNVPVFGSGSSFDGREFQKNADKMDVFNRWKEFQDHPWFKEYLL